MGGVQKALPGPPHVAPNCVGVGDTHCQIRRAWLECHIGERDVMWPMWGLCGKVRGVMCMICGALSQI